MEHVRAHGPHTSTDAPSVFRNALCTTVASPNEHLVQISRQSGGTPLATPLSSRNRRARRVFATGSMGGRSASGRHSTFPSDESSTCSSGARPASDMSWHWSKSSDTSAVSVPSPASTAFVSTEYLEHFLH